MDISDYVKPIQGDFDRDAYILHIDTNDLTADKKPDEICSEIPGNSCEIVIKQSYQIVKTK